MEKNPFHIKALPLVILAAGNSTRMNCPKGLLPLQGKPLLQHHLDDFFSSGGKVVVVVLNSLHRQKYFRALPQLNQKAQVIINDHSEGGGSFLSLQKGLQQLLAQENSFEGIFITPVDILPAEKELWPLLGKRLEKNPQQQVIYPTHNGRGGHPVLLRREFAQKLCGLSSFHSHSRLDFQIKKLADFQRGQVALACKKILGNFNYPDEWHKKNHSNPDLDIFQTHLI